MYEHKTYVVHGQGEHRLHGQSWSPAMPDAHVMLIHGFGEHSDRYANLIDGLLTARIAVHAVDHRGHGRSAGRRGHIQRWAEYRGDMAALWAGLPGDDRPRFVYGHSMGALIALDYVCMHPTGIRGLILSGLPLEPSVANPILIALSRLLSAVFPRLSMNLGLDPSALSRDSEVVTAYRHDPLVHGKASARWGTEMMDMMARAKTLGPSLKLPVLMLHGGDDTISPLAPVLAFADTIACQDRQLRVFDNCRHEPHNDPEHRLIIHEVVRWIRARAATPRHLEGSA